MNPSVGPSTPAATTDMLPPLLRQRRVALIHDWLNGMRGGERVLEQFAALFPEADVWTLCLEREKLSPALQAMRLRELKWAGTEHLRRHYRKALPLLPWLVSKFPTADYDLVIATSHCVAKAAPRPRRGMMAAYVFSPMRYVWDHFEDYLGAGLVQDTALRLVRRPLQRWDAGSNGGIDTLAADSAHIARKLRHFWQREARVIHPPVNLELYRPSGQPPQDYFLVVSALVPYKHIERAVEAATTANVPLKVVGDGPERARLQALAGPTVEFLGWEPDDVVAERYAHCRALLFPAAEDFGITALEAQAAGRPVIALGRGGVLETVLGGTTGCFFEAPTAAALAQCLREHQDAAYDSATIRRHAEGFSPLRFRAAVLEWLGNEAELFL